jgi:tetratricopeptide (TPR) repeat protein
MRSGRLLGLLGVLVYILITLLPDSSTEMLRWPWVLIWQTGLFCFVFAALISLARKSQPFFLLGNKLDWAIASIFVSLSLATIWAAFPQQALWQSLIGFALLITVYFTNNHLQQSQSLSGLLTLQGGLSLVFIVEGLALWTTQTLLPELAKIHQLRELGVNKAFNLLTLELRNWAPLGHQNYVAGYLMLCLPLLFVLAITQKGIWRLGWIAGLGLGLIDLYVTNSRGGVLGLAVMLAIGLPIWLWRSKLKPWQTLLWGGVGGVVIVVILGLANDRLRTFISDFALSRPNGELLFRLITATAGWKIGLGHWLVGAAPGSTPLLYQKYRPDWSGREAEMVFQLHSTPVQLWAEFGLVGAIATLITVAVLLGLLIRLHYSPSWLAHKNDQVITYGLFGGLLAYSVNSLSDYQLDVFAISGSLVITIASLAYIGQTHIPNQLFTLGDSPRLRPWLTATCSAFVIGSLIWLAPVDAAWHFSSVGFKQLDNIDNKNRVDGFVTNLTRAHELASWESYYSYQLGWTLSEVAQSVDANQAPAIQKKALEWMQKGIAANPNQEFGYNTAAWLSLAQQSPQAAEKMFRKGLQLVPAKRSLYFGLGLSLLQQGKKDEGIKAIAKEWINDPIFITSPMWQNSQWRVILDKISDQLDTLYVPAVSADTKLKDTRAAAHWWLGKPNAITEMAKSNSATAQAIAAVAANKTEQIQSFIRNPQAPAQLAIAAWLTPDRRQALLSQAWTSATKEMPDKSAEAIVKAMLERMNQSKSFDTWLRAPIPEDSPLNLRSRRQRANFGIISRHIDGINPLDLFNVQENAIISVLFPDLFPSAGNLSSLRE